MSHILVNKFHFDNLIDIFFLGFLSKGHEYQTNLTKVDSSIVLLKQFSKKTWVLSSTLEQIISSVDSMFVFNCQKDVAYKPELPGFEVLNMSNLSLFITCTTWNPKKVR